MPPVRRTNEEQILADLEKRVRALERAPDVDLPPPPTPGLQLIDQVIVSSPVGDMEFAGVPASFRHLALLVSGRSDDNTGVAARNKLWLNFNLDLGYTYDYQFGANGYGIEEGQPQMRVGWVAENRDDADTFVATFCLIPNYASSSCRKEVATLFSGGFIAAAAAFPYIADVIGSDNAGRSQEGRGLGSGRWNSTDPVTDILLRQSVGNFVAGTTASLYGLL